MKPATEIIAARLSEMAVKGAKIKRLGRMCSTCAFKKGSVTQTEEHNVHAAMNCLAYEGLFNCHPSGGTGNAGRPCVGFLHAKQHLNS